MDATEEEDKEGEHNLQHINTYLHVVLPFPGLSRWEGYARGGTTRSRHSLMNMLMKGTKVQTLGGRAVAGAWLVAWAIMAGHGCNH